MSTRTYRGKSIGPVMSKIRQELGDEARIVETRAIDQNLVEVEVMVGSQRSSNARGSAMLSEEIIGNVSGIQPISNTKSSILQQLHTLLTSQGLSRQFTSLITSRVNIPKRTSKSVTEILAEGLSDIFPLESRLPLTNKYIAFLGPTGVGKTTTIAKLAARIRLAFQAKIALISADSYRIGAGFQLQTYASLMHLPCRVLDPSEDMASQLGKAMKAFEDFDLVFIDVAGFGYRHTAKLDELANCLQEFPEIERLLLLPAPSNTTDLCNVVRAFSKIGIDRSLITKLDETGFIGPVIEAAAILGKPLAFFTNGQRVPEDIEPASLMRIASLFQRTVH